MCSKMRREVVRKVGVRGEKGQRDRALIADFPDFRFCSGVEKGLPGL